MIHPDLTPDCNRPKLESILAKELSHGKLPDSLTHIDCSDEKPRILLIVPYYTRIVKPLDIIMEGIYRDEKDPQELAYCKTVTQTLRDNSITELSEMKRAGIPMGLLRVGTAAKRAGYNVRILDAPFEDWDNEQHYFTSAEGSIMMSYGLSRAKIAQIVRQYDPHIVGITIDYTHQWGNAREVADLMKLLKPEIPVVMGGAHVGEPDNSCVRDALIDSPIDYVVLQEADHAFVALADFLTGKNSRPISEINGIAYRNNNLLEIRPQQKFLSDISAIAIPDLSLINLDRYNKPFHSAGARKQIDGNILYGFTSIGCNVKCDFCTIPSIQGPTRYVPQALQEQYFSTLQAAGVTELLIDDDNLFHDPLAALQMMSTLKKYDFACYEEGGVALYSLIALLPEVSISEIQRSVRAGEENKFNRILAAKKSGVTTTDMVRAMHESGFYGLYLAVESANTESLYDSHKPALNANQEQTIKIVRMMTDYGLDVTCGFMLGFIGGHSKGIYRFGESKQMIRQSISYGKRLKQAGTKFVNPFCYTILPGAEHFFDLLPMVDTSTDDGFSHELATIEIFDFGDGKGWSRNWLDLIRVGSIIETEGIEGYKRLRTTGTWPT